MCLALCAHLVQRCNERVVEPSSDQGREPAPCGPRPESKLLDRSWRRTEDRHHLTMVRHLERLPSLHSPEHSAALVSKLAVRDDRHVAIVAVACSHRRSRPDVRPTTGNVTRARRASGRDGLRVRDALAEIRLRFRDSSGSPPYRGQAKPQTNRTTAIELVSEGGLEPPCPIRALAPQASASTYSATRTWVARILRASQTTLTKSGCRRAPWQGRMVR